MDKIDPKGSYFAAGRTVGGASFGASGGGPGRPALSSSHKAKDAKMLAALGGTPVNHVLEAEERQKQALLVMQKNGKALFR